MRRPLEPGVVAALAVTLLYRGRPYWAWVGPGAIGLPWWAGANSPDQLGAAFAVVATTFVVLALVLGVPSVRAVLVSRFVMRVMRSVLPRIGDPCFT